MGFQLFLRNLKFGGVFTEVVEVECRIPVRKSSAGGQQTVPIVTERGIVGLSRFKRTLPISTWCIGQHRKLENRFCPVPGEGFHRRIQIFHPRNTLPAPILLVRGPEGRRGIHLIELNPIRSQNLKGPHALRPSLHQLVRAFKSRSSDESGLHPSSV